MITYHARSNRGVFFCLYKKKYTFSCILYKKKYTSSVILSGNQFYE
nr:MAG TPA: hypothetical protein [Caudoviricetes sp.]